VRGFRVCRTHGARGDAPGGISDVLTLTWHPAIATCFVRRIRTLLRMILERFFMIRRNELMMDVVAGTLH
jgi:hypothetical protein